jgi:hypothetical protein
MRNVGGFRSFYTIDGASHVLTRNDIGNTRIVIAYPTEFVFQFIVLSRLRNKHRLHMMRA